MAKQRPTSGKRQRERDKEARAIAKRERRQTKPEAPDTAVDGDDPVVVPSAVVLELLAEAHRQFQNDEISFEEYDETKADLLRKLHVD